MMFGQTLPVSFFTRSSGEPKIKSFRPKTISEQLLFSTVRVDVRGSASSQFVGTGFVYDFHSEEFGTITALITNEHVVSAVLSRNAALTLTFHVAKEIHGFLYPTGFTEPIELENLGEYWVPHPEADENDLGAIILSPLMKRYRRDDDVPLYLVSLDRSYVKSDQELEKTCSAIEPVVMYGYPVGLSDTFNHLPLIRSGITATHPAIDFKAKSWGVIDAAAMHGSSGSPVLILYEAHKSFKDVTYFWENKRLYLLGVLFGGATKKNLRSAEVLHIKSLTSGEDNYPINLGYYVKARELNTLQYEIEHHIKKLSASGGWCPGSLKSIPLNYKSHRELNERKKATTSED